MGPQKDPHHRYRWWICRHEFELKSLVTLTFFTFLRRLIISSCSEEESSCLFARFLAIFLFRLSIMGWNRIRHFGKSDRRLGQFKAEDSTSGAGYSIVWAARWMSGLELATHGALTWLKRNKLGIEWIDWQHEVAQRWKRR